MKGTGEKDLAVHKKIHLPLKCRSSGTNAKIDELWH